jgi:hypothetical protein
MNSHTRLDKLTLSIRPKKEEDRHREGAALMLLEPV